MSNAIKIVVLLMAGLIISLPLTGAVNEAVVIQTRENKISLRVDNLFIDKYGADRLKELKNNIAIAVATSVYNEVVFEYDSDGYVNPIGYSSNKLIMDWDLTGLVLICQMIAELAMLFFGHGDLGYYIALLSCMIVMFFPARLLSIPAMIEDYSQGGAISEVILGFIERLLGSGGGMIDELLDLIYELGLIGGIFAILLTSPVLIVVAVIILILLPLILILIVTFIRAVYTYDVLWYILGSAGFQYMPPIDE